ncbi:uncharacterized protein JCM6883_005654 [Sporobolomyces salmoneus]|uniref:uncharacterized protein n=1 Tax=Sporobolomyces salmoneus TaxID=183962 RepID=UPI0031800B77
MTTPFLPPVPPPWTEHKAPGGQPYWFNPITNVSTYTRPLAPPPPPGFAIAGAVPPPPAGFPVVPTSSQFAPPLHFSNSADNPAAAGAPTKKKKKEKPKEKLPIEGTSWIRVTTNKGNVFYNHKETKESVWTVPDEIKDQVEALEKKERELREEEEAKKVREEELERSSQRKRKAEDQAEKEDVTAEQGAADDEKAGDGEEKGQLEIEIEGVNGNVPSAVPTESKPSASPSTAPPPVDEPPKKKKPKTKVVSSIEELETEEDWQRQMAEQMAKEAQEAEEKERKEMAEAMKPDVVQAKEQTEKLEVNQIEAAAMYKVLLEEKDINPMAPFENELPKFVNDPRYHAVKSQRDRRDVFDEFCKEKIRERRAAKAKLAQSGIKVDPLEAYRALLSSTVTSTRTHFSDFKKAHGKDSRFREFGKNEGEKEKEFKKYLRDLGEKKREAAEKAEREFKEMLTEDGEIKEGDKWADVKKRHATNPRYAAVNSSSLREQLFTKFLSSLSSSSRPQPSTSSAPSASKPTTSTKEDKAARAAASLREREERVRLEKSKAERNAQQARGHLGKEEAEREFGQLLIDAVRDHKARFEDVEPNLSQDPRFDHPSLTPRDKRRLFDQHLSTLHRKRISAIESLFSEHAPLLNTPFHDVLPSISDSPHVTRLFGSNFNALEDLYSSWQSRRAVQAKDEFYQLLKESPILEHWGRLKKMEKREEVKLIGEEGTRNDESDDEETGVREMADQVDLKAVHATLKNDKRYLIWNHEPEKREEWIEDYVENKLTAPKMTVHQRD